MYFYKSILISLEVQIDNFKTIELQVTYDSLIMSPQLQFGNLQAP